jgi:hypothetical protein
MEKCLEHRNWGPPSTPITPTETYSRLGILYDVCPSLSVVAFPILNISYLTSGLIHKNYGCRITQYVDETARPAYDASDVESCTDTSGPRCEVHGEEVTEAFSS